MHLFGVCVCFTFGAVQWISKRFLSKTTLVMQFVLSNFFFGGGGHCVKTESNTKIFSRCRFGCSTRYSGDVFQIDFGVVFGVF